MVVFVLDVCILFLMTKKFFFFLEMRKLFFCRLDVTPHLYMRVIDSVALTRLQWTLLLNPKSNKRFNLIVPRVSLWRNHVNLWADTVTCGRRRVTGAMLQRLRLVTFCQIWGDCCRSAIPTVPLDLQIWHKVSFECEERQENQED